MTYILLSYEMLRLPWILRLLILAGIVVSAIAMYCQDEKIFNKGSACFWLLLAANILVSMAYNKLGISDGMRPDLYWCVIDIVLIVLGTIQCSHYVLSFGHILLAAVVNYSLGFAGYYAVRYYLLPLVIIAVVIIIFYFIFLGISNYTETTGIAGFIANGFEGTWEAAMMFWMKMKGKGGLGWVLIIAAVLCGLAFAGYLFSR